MTEFRRSTGFLPAILICLAGAAFAHGDVAPQPVNTDALPNMGTEGEDWLSENPYRDTDDGVWRQVVAIGESGFTQNCARCHGLGAVSGGLAPDLRYLEPNEFGDEWFLERFRDGYTQNGTTKMPAFGEVLDEKAAWAIKTYVESRPEDGAYDAISARLGEIRDRLAEIGTQVDGGSDAAQFSDEGKSLQEELAILSADIMNAYGEGRTDSIAARAANSLSGDQPAYKIAAETLTIGLSAAH
ncbi:MAG: cytochrome c-550 PedF [Paracoccus sp. (in: a-proteobacteria)]